MYSTSVTVFYFNRTRTRHNYKMKSNRSAWTMKTHPTANNNKVGTRVSPNPSKFRTRKERWRLLLCRPAWSAARSLRGNPSVHVLGLRCPPREPIGRRRSLAETTKLIKAIISRTVTAKVFWPHASAYLLPEAYLCISRRPVRRSDDNYS